MFVPNNFMKLFEKKMWLKFKKLKYFYYTIRDSFITVWFKNIYDLFTNIKYVCKSDNF